MGLSKKSIVANFTAPPYFWTALIQIRRAMNPVRVDVIYPLPEGWGLCLTCEAMIAQAQLDQAPYERGLEEYPPEWRQEYEKLSAAILGLADRYQSGIYIRLWDPRSLQGLLKSIRYGVRCYPTFIVAGRQKVTGWQTDLLEQQIQAAGGVPQA